MAGILGIPHAMKADSLVTVNYTEYFDNQTDGYYGPLPTVPESAPLNIPIGSSVTWTATIDVTNPPTTPALSLDWTIASSNLPTGLTDVLAPWTVFLLPFVDTYEITGIAPTSFTWQGETYLGAYTIQFPDCPLTGSCTATTPGKYYFPGYWTYASTTFDTLNFSTSASTPTPEPGTPLLILVALAALWLGARHCQLART